MRTLAAATVGAVMLSRSAMAQGTAPTTTAVMTGTAADTGRMAPGHVEFSRYETPSDCLAASWLVIRSTLIRRTPDASDPQDRDTLQGAMDTDTVPTEAITIARRCAASKFSAAGVAKEDIADLQELAVMMRDSALAAAAMARRLSFATTTRERADVLMATIELYRLARPAQLQATTPVLAKLDALGPAAREDQMGAHMALAGDYRKRFDRVGVKREAERVIALFGAMPPSERETVLDTAESAYRMLLAVQEFENPKGVYALLDRIRADIGTTTRGKQQITPKAKPPYKPGQASMFAGMFTREWWDDSHGSREFSNVQQYWFDRNGPTAARPLPGKVTLFVSPIGSDDQSLIRKLHEKYGPDGLDIAMWTQTAGYAYVDGQPHVMTPEQEAEAHRQEYLEKAHLPIALGVFVTAFTRDSVTGERVDEPISGPFGLLDSEGHVVTWWGYPYGEDFARLEAYLDRLFAKR